MEKSLVELFEAVKKAADEAVSDGGINLLPAEDLCIDALEQLKKFPVTYQVLVSSQVGKRLRQLTKHPKKRIQALASDVVEMWKTIVVKETSKKRENPSAESEGTVKSEPGDPDSGEAKRARKVTPVGVVNSKSSEPAKGDSDDKKNLHKGSSLIVEKVSTAGPVKIEKVEPSSVSYAKNVGNPETPRAGIKGKKFKVVENEKIAAGERINTTKTPKQEKVTADLSKSGSPKLTSVLYCKDQQRDKFREILAQALCKVSGEVDEDLKDAVDACDPYRVALLVETKMFEKWGRSNGPHNAKYRSIKYNITDANNPDFRRKVLLGIFPPNSIVELSADDMASDARKMQNKKIEEKALLECQRGAPPQATTDQFKCGRCRKSQATYFQLQTRSADEPMTSFITCVNCGNHWKC